MQNAKCKVKNGPAILASSEPLRFLVLMGLLAFEPWAMPFCYTGRDDSADQIGAADRQGSFRVSVV